MNAPTLLDSLREAQTLDEDKPGVNPPTPITAEEEWSWSPDNSDIVIAHQPAIGIYRNGWGSITIRQERSWDEEEDTFVLVAPENLENLIRALSAFVRKASRSD
jgi:hypothetical protein